MSDYVPFKPGEHYVPEHYRPIKAIPGRITLEADVTDILDAFGLLDDLLVGDAIRYLMRAGRKDTTSFARDLNAACEQIQRRLSIMVRDADESVVHGNTCGNLSGPQSMQASTTGAPGNRRPKPG